MRRTAATIGAILRTNAFVPAGADALAIKLDSARVPGQPRPVPWREIFVYSRRVEGIHLRAGPVARGGLRWSDRRDDFRTEVLGLMKAQRVKNAVIVPTGAKGGFYPKQLPDPAEDLGAEVVAPVGPADAAARHGPGAQVDAFDAARIDEHLAPGHRPRQAGDLRRIELEREGLDA